MTFAAITFHRQTSSYSVIPRSRSEHRRVPEVNPSELALCSDTDFSSGRMNAYVQLPGFKSDAVPSRADSGRFPASIEWFQF